MKNGQNTGMFKKIDGNNNNQIRIELHMNNNE